MKTTPQGGDSRRQDVKTDEALSRDLSVGWHRACGYPLILVHQEHRGWIKPWTLSDGKLSEGEMVQWQMPSDFVCGECGEFLEEDEIEWFFSHRELTETTNAD